ncbi:MAG: hypothetical protein LBC59_03105 [Chitinispirillales bacterium]|nr:hypothetical protein [Chitinispirillales bacterium]
MITAVGTGSIKSADDMSPSSPIVIDADGDEVGALKDFIDDGEVGVIVVDSLKSTSNDKNQNH